MQATWKPLPDGIDIALLEVDCEFELKPKPIGYSKFPLAVNADVQIHGFNKPEDYGAETLNRSVRAYPNQHGVFILDGAVLNGFSGSPVCLSGEVAGVVIAKAEDRALILPLDTVMGALPDHLPSCWQPWDENKPKQKAVPFLYSPSEDTASTLGMEEKSTRRLRAKMDNANLGHQFNSLHIKSVSTESRLLEIAAEYEDDFLAMLNQIENVVKGECNEAFVSAVVKGGQFGIVFIDEIYKRLASISSDRPEMVYGEQKECLIGMVGLLGGDCQIWFGQPFDIGEDL